MTRIGDCAIQASKICQYIPVVSSISSSVEILGKACIKGNLSNIPRDSYRGYIRHKSIKRLAIGLVPVVGNIALGIWDLRHRSKALPPAIIPSKIEIDIEMAKDNLQDMVSEDLKLSGLNALYKSPNIDWKDVFSEPMKNKYFYLMKLDDHKISKREAYKTQDGKDIGFEKGTYMVLTVNVHGKEGQKSGMGFFCITEYNPD